MQGDGGRRGRNRNQEQDAADEETKQPRGGNRNKQQKAREPIFNNNDAFPEADLI